MTPAPAIRSRDLAVGYGSRRSAHVVLEGLNLTVESHDLVCLLGPNGAGKSTLLRTLARLQPAVHGSIDLNGTNAERLTSADIARSVGVVLTDRVAIDATTARRIVEFGRYSHTGWLGTLGPRDHEIVEWALTAVGASHLADRDFSRLSDGERQRVMVARALAQQPAVLILDEPTSYLDVSARMELIGVLRRLVRAQPLAVILSTHDVELAVRFADVLWLIGPGGECAIGAPEDVVMSGAVARAFEGSHVRFDPESRTFRTVGGEAGTAVVRGAGLRVALARAVLERHGYDVLDRRPEVDVDVEVVGDEWLAQLGGVSMRGTDFAALAAFLRRTRAA